MKYYAVKKGYTTGIFDNWAECQKAISGFSHPDFKGFKTREEAEAYLSDTDLWKEKIKEDIKNGYIVAYTDGSFDKDLQRYSYGVVIIDDKMQEFSLCGYGDNKKYLSSNNIIGEIFGVINAMDWAVSNGYCMLKVYHDYEGLSKWISGEWKASSDAAKMYVSIYNEKFDGVLDVEFVKVKGHSNNSYNDKADALAGSALQDRKRVAVQGDHWFSIPHFKKEDLETMMDLIKEVDQNISVVIETYGLRTIYRLRLHSDRLTVTHFNSGAHKILVQGQPTLLFQIVVAVLSELEDIRFERVLGNAYRRSIDKEKVDAAYNATVPVFPADYPANNKKFIRQAIINLQYYIDCEDYAQYAFPALRALEGHIKYLIQKAGGPLGKKFYQFNKDPVTLQYVLTAPLTDTSKKPLIEKCYNYYKSQRDTIFHFGDLMGSTDTTRMIQSKDEADEIINGCISLICET